MYSVGDACPTCKKGKLVRAQPSSGAQFICDQCGKTHANGEGKMGVGMTAVRLRVRSGEKVRGKPKRELDHSVKSDSEVRYVRRRDELQTSIIQVAWTPDRRVKHIDCKNCGNTWYLADKRSYEAEFEFDGTNVTCKKCGVQMPIS